MAYLDDSGLQYVWAKIKAKIPTKTSQLSNDSDYVTADTVRELQQKITQLEAEIETLKSGQGLPYTYGTEDLTAGSSALESGKLHFVYE